MMVCSEAEVEERHDTKRRLDTRPARCDGILFGSVKGSVSRLPDGKNPAEPISSNSLDNLSISHGVLSQIMCPHLNAF